MKASGGTVTYYVLVCTQTLSWMGSQTSSLAVGIAVFRLSGHAPPLALVGVFWAAPRIVLGGLGGALADRLDRRSLMLAANVGYAIASGLLLLAFVSGAFRLWELYTLTVANSVLGALEAPALQASVAMLVPDRHRDRANAIQELSYPSATIIAAAFAGLLYASIGVVGAIAVNMATFGVALAVLALIRIPMPETSAEGRAAAGGLWRQSFGGFGYLAGRPALLTLIIYISLVGATAGGFFWALMTPYILDRVHATSTFGVVYGIGFSGAIVGALAMAAWGGTRSRIHTVMVSTLLAGAGVALTGAARTPVLLAGSMFLLTFVIPFANAAISSILQGQVPPDLQGRVFAAMGQLSGLLVPLASLTAGPLADRVFEPAVTRPGWGAVAWAVGGAPGAGIGLMYVLAGLWILGLTAAVYASPAVRRVEAAGSDRATVASAASA
jgi:DHA3 family macrolide efflux protein-like MFS transporter